MKILDAILYKGRELIIGKLRTIVLIKADLQCIMRMHLSDEYGEIIEKDNRFLKWNCSSRSNYSIEIEILEKRLMFNNSLLSAKVVI